MPIYQQISEAYKTALKAHQAAQVEVLRYGLSELQKFSKNRGDSSVETIQDQECVQVLQKEIKRRREAVEMFKQGGRLDLVDKELAGIAILSQYVPQAMTEQEVEAEVLALKKTGLNDFPGLMKAVSNQVRGRADGKMVAEVVRRLISE